VNRPYRHDINLLCIAINSDWMILVEKISRRDVRDIYSGISKQKELLGLRSSIQLMISCHTS